MEIIYLLAALALLLLAALVYTMARAGKRERKKIERICELEEEVHHLKGRHLTATGGLSRNDKNRVLDLIAKADALEDDSKLVNARIADLKRNLIEFMKRR